MMFQAQIVLNQILGLLTFLVVTSFVPIVNARSVIPINSISTSLKNLNSSPTLLNKGKQLYDEGNFAAAKVWELAFIVCRIP